MSETVRDTVILGSGCAGLTAAIYTARANLKPLVLEGHEPGGQLSITTLVENFPGWPDGIQGPELIENMKRQAARFGAEYAMNHLVSVDLSKRPFALNLGSSMVHTRTLIIASGASARWLGLPSEQALIGHGVSSCATCDGFFFMGKEIAVIGGGDSAMEEALFLTRFATKVTLIHRRESFRASKIMLERAMAHDKIQFLTNTAVEEVMGVDEREVSGLRLRNVTSGDESVLPVSGVFLGIGHVPNAKMFAGQIDLDDDGYVLTHDNVFTRVPGSFPAATCRTGAIGRRLRRPGRVAWRRSRSRNTWKNTAGNCGYGNGGLPMPDSTVSKVRSGPLALSGMSTVTPRRGRMRRFRDCRLLMWRFA